MKQFEIKLLIIHNLCNMTIYVYNLYQHSTYDQIFNYAFLSLIEKPNTNVAHRDSKIGWTATISENTLESL